MDSRSHRCYFLLLEALTGRPVAEANARALKVFHVRRRESIDEFIRSYPSTLKSTATNLQCIYGHLVAAQDPDTNRPTHAMNSSFATATTRSHSEASLYEYSIVGIVSWNILHLLLPAAIALAL